MLIHKKAKAIRLLILDVDGILTSGVIFYGNEKEMVLKGFHIRDGLGIKLLQKTGVAVAIITAKNSQAAALRAQELNIPHVYLGYEIKKIAYDELKQKLNLQDKQIAYMGDDLPDLPLLTQVGFAITVPEAPEIIREKVDYITTHQGGAGAVRETCELIMHAQKSYESVIQSYFS